tara:strand:+ start:3654 stop:3821 length:168 start_codon:yes stop_codon:yes gene_type:complete
VALGTRRLTWRDGGTETVPAQEAEKQVRGVQPVSPWQGEIPLRGVQPVPAREAEG